jgi:hypothetical protein
MRKCGLMDWMDWMDTWEFPKSIGELCGGADSRISELSGAQPLVPGFEFTSHIRVIEPYLQPRSESLTNGSHGRTLEFFV